MSSKFQSRVNKGNNKNSTKARELREKSGTKERALMDNLHDVESKQLDSFIKNRSQQLDAEIKNLQNKLGGYNTASIANDSLQHTALQSTLNVSGEGMGKKQLNTDLFRHTVDDPTGGPGRHHSAAERPFTINLEPYGRKMGGAEEPRDELQLLLGKVRLAMKDRNIPPSLMKEYLLPSDLTIPEERYISVPDLMDVLQTELLIAVTKNDLYVLLKNYGSEEDEAMIDAQKFMMDAGIWNDSEHALYSPKKGSVSPGEKEGGFVSPPRAQYHSSRYPDSSTPNQMSNTVDSLFGTTQHHSPTGKRAGKDLYDTRQLNTAHNNINDLADLHELAREDELFDNPQAARADASLARPAPEYLSRHRKAEERATLDEKQRRAEGPEHAEIDSHNRKNEEEYERIQKALKNDESSRPISKSDATTGATPLDAADTNAPTDAKTAALAAENERLKNELKAFDSDFFSELEDLKYRYARLQEIVGEDPSAAAKRKEQQRNPLPLDRLSWSARNSMTAMDRAGLTSPLVAGRSGAYSNPHAPRFPSSHTYTAGGIASQNIGGRVKETSNAHGSDLLLRTGGNGTYGDGVLSGVGLMSHPMSIQHKRGPATLYGGVHGVGSGIHDPVTQGAAYNGPAGDSVALNGGTYSNMCERRLVFELTNHPRPSHAISSLIHRVMAVADRAAGFITCPQLAAALSSVGLRMSQQEVELLATGFASDAQGGVDAQEFCELVNTLLYNLIGEHAARQAEVQATINGQTVRAQSEDEFLRIMAELCESILAHDKRAVIGSSTNLYRTLLKPFVERDIKSAGVLDFETFGTVLKDMGSMLSYQDVTVIAQRYGVDGERAESAYKSSNLDHIETFRNAQTQGSLRGAASVDPVFGNWLSSSGIGLEGTLGGQTGPSVDYPPFVQKLSEMLERLLETKGGVVMGANHPWMLKEYEFIDTLICQLEAMKSSHRRRVLMSLQYALASADSKQECELDGFAVLNALLTAGFRLHRANRVNLLRAVEEMGGKLDYRDLCQILFNSCADWTAEERSVVSKILKSMGITVTDRRGWLAKLKQMLMEASARVARKSGTWAVDRTSSGRTQHSGNSTGGIPPAAFLHCLRDCGVILTVDEEATLLDCLDTERLAREGDLSAHEEGGNGMRARSGRTGGDRVAHGTAMNSQEVFSVPQIHYEEFLQFCARHCGSWVDSAPELGEVLKEAVKNVSNPVLAVHEFASLVHGFDETSCGSISRRSFHIACHRSRLLSSMADDEIELLTEIMTVDGGGKVDYTPFIVHMRAIVSKMGEVDEPVAPTIIDQLIRNATDQQGTLVPLRNWIMRNTDIVSFILTAKDLNALFREFSVMYRPEDLEKLQMDIGRHVEVRSKEMEQYGAGRTMDDIDRSFLDQHTVKKHVIDSRDLLAHVLKARPHWTLLHPKLCERMLKTMMVSGAQMFGDGSESSASHTNSDVDDTAHLYGEYGVNQSSMRKTASGEMKAGAGGSFREVGAGPRGVETAVARRVLARLRAFSSRANIVNDHAMIETDIFAHLTRLAGLPLSDADVLILADATDNLPEAKRVRCDVILEALLYDPSKTIDIYADESKSGTKDYGRFTGSSLVQKRDRKLTEAGVFALEHIRSLIWNSAARLHRTSLQWSADVKTVVQGFDKGNTGFIASEDFALALSLLNASVSPELLMDISHIPEGPGLIDYKDILEFILIPPAAKHVDNTTQPFGRPASSSSAETDSTRKQTNSNPNIVRLKKNPTLKAELNKKESPVELLLNVVRRSLQQFIVSDSSLEMAWVCLLKVFQRFDPTETNKVSPRDFCLAIAVLLEGDDIILTQMEWAEIIEYFSASSELDPNGRKSHSGAMGGAMVDYMLFCEAVLDPAEIKQRRRELKNGYGDSSLERSKQHLSKGPNIRARGAAAGTRLASSSSGGSRGDFDGEVSGHAAAVSQRKFSASIGGDKDRKKYLDLGSDDITKRFDKLSSSKHYDTALSGGDIGSGNTSRTVYSGTGRSPWNTDALYRTSKTAGQTSRDHHRAGGSPEKANNFSSSSDLARYINSPGKPSSREVGRGNLNQTTGTAGARGALRPAGSARANKSGAATVSFGVSGTSMGGVGGARPGSANSYATSHAGNGRANLKQSWGQ